MKYITATQIKLLAFALILVTDIRMAKIAGAHECCWSLLGNYWKLVMFGSLANPLIYQLTIHGRYSRLSARLNPMRWAEIVVILQSLGLAIL
jgi:hypothetical protein